MIELILSGILLALAGLHAYWGAGGFWPAQDSFSLARTVAGFRGIRAMPPPSSCVAVAAILVAAALLPLILAGRLDLGVDPILPKIAGIGLALVFLGRGLAAWLPAWRMLAPEQPFARLDTRLYGPLCLFIGVLFLITLVGGIKS